MADSSIIPFGSIFDRIRNRQDDDFDQPYDDRDESMRDGIALILITCTFLFLLVILRYGCIWFIDVVILCDYRRYRRPNHTSRCRPLLSHCCPRCFPPLEEDPDDLGEGEPDDHPSDGPTATNTSSDSNSDSSNSSEEDGMERIRASNSTYAKRMMKILTEEQKRSLFAIILDNRTVTQSDISEWPEAGGKSNVSSNCSSTEISDEDQITTDTTNAEVESLSSSAIVVPDGGPTVAALPNAADNDICCPICIQDIKVGDRVCHSKRKNCHHLFHFDCILEWLGRGSTLCPYCRREIFTRRMLEEAYHQLQQQQHQSSTKNHAV